MTKTLPKDFIFGGATAAYQAEGATNTDWENDFETFIEKIEKIENLKIAPFLLRRQYCPAIDD